MSKIATYSLADSPLQLSDRLIGTEAPRPTPSATPLATKNFSLGELLQLFSTNFPAYPLQDVLDENNTATQDINLTGTINVTLIKPTNIEDMLGSQGTPLQILSKGVGGICWIDIPNVSGFVPTSRELTINGVTYDLSANRSWTISGATWGSITGTISSQTDLINFLDGNFYPLSSNPAGYITQDNVVEYPDLASFPPTGVIGTIYIALDTGLFYSWNGTAYVLSSPPDTGITGVGTTNTYPKFTSPTTIGNGRLVDGINGGIYTFGSQWINLINGGNVLRLNRSQSFMEFTLGVQNFFATTIYSSQAKEGLIFDSQGDFAIGSGGPLLTPTQRLFIDRITGNIHIGGAANAAASEKLQVTGNLRVTGAFLDSSNSAGTTGQLLSSTLTGTQWINAPTGGVTSVAALTIGTSGTDLSSTVDNPTTTPVITLNVPTASALNRGVLSSSDWTSFNNRKRRIITDTTSVVISGTISLTLAKTYELTAGTLSASGFLDVYMFSSRTGNSGVHSMGLYINTTNNFATATLIAAIGTAGNFNPHLPGKLQYILKNNLILGGFFSPTSGSNMPSSATRVSVTCNNTSASVWLFVGVTPSSVQTITLEGVEILN